MREETFHLKSNQQNFFMAIKIQIVGASRIMLHESSLHQAAENSEREWGSN